MHTATGGMEEKRLYVSAGETWREDAPQEGAGRALPEILVPVLCPLARSQRPVGAGLTRSAHTLQQPVSDYRFAWKGALSNWRSLLAQRSNELP
jgi:hypothetical protein